MHSVQLKDNLSVKPQAQVIRTEEAAIHAEIAVRVLELKELVGPNKTVNFFERTLSIFHLHPAGPEAYWVLMRLLTGDLTEITRSYTERGKDQARSKQATQQELERILAGIQLHYPHLAAAMISIRNVHANICTEA